jgi:hypothetical protein
MADWKKLAIQVLLADNKLDDTEVKLIRRELFADKVIEDEEVKFLLDLRTRARAKKAKVHPTFDKLFYSALETNILADGRIDAREAASLKTILGKPAPGSKRQKEFLSRLKKAAKSTDPEFNKLCTAFGVK